MEKFCFFFCSAVLSMGIALTFYTQMTFIPVILIFFACCSMIWLLLRKIVSYCIFPGSLWFFRKSLELIYSKEISLQVFKKFEKLKNYLQDLDSDKFEDSFNVDSTSKKLLNTLIENILGIDNKSRKQRNFLYLLMELKSSLEQITLECNSELINFWMYLEVKNDMQDKIFRYVVNEKNSESIKKSLKIVNQIQQITKKSYEKKSCFSRFLEFFEGLTLGTLDYLRSDLMKRFYCERHLIDKKIDSILVKCEEESQSAVMICNPNAGFYEFIYFQSEWLEFYLSRGVNVILWNYQGYGQSRGKPSVISNIEDGKKVLEFYISKGISKVCIHGESIGASVAVHLGKSKVCQFVLADRTFGCLSDVIKYGYGIFAWICFKVSLLPDVNNTQAYLDLECYKVITCDPCDRIIPDFVSLKNSVALCFVMQMGKTIGEYFRRKMVFESSYVMGCVELEDFCKRLAYLMAKYLRTIEDDVIEKRKTTLKTEINEETDPLFHYKFLNLISELDACGVPLKSVISSKNPSFILHLWLQTLEIWGSFNGFFFSIDLSPLTRSISDMQECIASLCKLEKHEDFLNFSSISSYLQRIMTHIQSTLNRSSLTFRSECASLDYSKAGAFMLVNCGHGGHFNNMNRHNLEIHLTHSSFL
jgi:hypothetical protein